MKIANLVRPEHSDIKYVISHFPDGQQDITVTEGCDEDTNEVLIKARFNSFEDLELIICLTKALRRLDVEKISLYIPYILGARSDRKFKMGGTSYLVDVIAPIINAQNYKSVSCIDAHSDVAAACINNLKILDNKVLVEFVLFNLYGSSKVKQSPKFRFIAPDAGSIKKLYKASDSVGYQEELIICSKYRDTDGKLSRTQVTIPVHDADKDCIIVDDICDGGATFLNIKTAIDHSRSLSSAVSPDNYGKTYLVVTHGIFSKGYEDLIKCGIDGVFCTNSVKDIDNEFIKQIDLF